MHYHTLFITLNIWSKTAFISNGNATSEVLDYIRPWTDCYKIDLKAMDDKRYRELGGVLQHVVDAVRMVHERGFWLEIVTLIVPGFNDDDAQLTRAAELAVVAVAEALQVDLVQRDEGADVVEHLGRGIAIGDEGRLESRRPGDLEHVHRPFGGNQRLVVRRSHHPSALSLRQCDERVGRHVTRDDPRVVVA